MICGRILPFILILFLSLQLTAQTNPYTFHLNYHYGFVMNHSINMAHLANQRPWGLELDASRQRTGEKEWEQIHNYPITGMALTWLHMDPEKPLGDSWSLIFYYSQKFLKGKKFYGSYRIGIGPGYIEKRFDRVNNYKNNLISSRINYGLNGRLIFTWLMTSQLRLNFGLGLMHYSNGAMKVPNLGINIPTVHIGLGFRPAKEETSFKKDSLSPTDKKIRWNFLLAGGFKQAYPVEGPSWFASTFSSFVSRQVSRRSALALGTDIFYDASSKIQLDSLRDIGEAKDIKYFRWGFTIGHEFLINRLTLLTQLGWYAYDPLKREKSVYQRVALRYALLPKTFAFMGLKTHFAQAEYVEWGVGVKL